MGCYNSAVISAPADEVWATMRNFHDLSWATDVITSVEADGEPTQPGAKRVLNGAFSETLLTVDDESRTLQYSIDDGPDAVSRENVQGYIGKVQVFPVTADNTAFVLWSSSWVSGGEGAQELCDPIYRALLASLAAHHA